VIGQTQELPIGASLSEAFADGAQRLSPV